MVSALTCNVRWAEVACIVTFPRLFNLNHSRSQVTQYHCTVWSGQHTREINNYNVRENSFHETSYCYCHLNTLNISQKTNQNGYIPLDNRSKRCYHNRATVCPQEQNIQYSCGHIPSNYTKGNPLRKIEK